ncbi:MAG: hypothetical protein ABIG46_08915 [Candidatus Omnitrophota bacterium]
MNKQDIYEHLANVYLDNSLKKKNEVVSPPKTKYKYLYPSFILIILLALSLYFTIAQVRSNPINTESTYVLLSDSVKVGFKFDPGKKQIYAINLNGLNLSKYKYLGVSLRKSDLKDNVSVRTEFVNSFKEKSELYLKNIPFRWKAYRILMDDFKGITDWTDMLNLAFILEEWNVENKSGALYIDNVVLLK